MLNVQSVNYFNDCEECGLRIYSHLTLKLEQGNLARGTLGSLHQVP